MNTEEGIAVVDTRRAGVLLYRSRARRTAQNPTCMQRYGRDDARAKDQGTVTGVCGARAVLADDDPSESLFHYAHLTPSGSSSDRCCMRESITMDPGRVYKRSGSLPQSASSFFITQQHKQQYKTRRTSAPTDTSTTTARHQATAKQKYSTKFMTQASINMPSSISFTTSTTTKSSSQSIYNRPQKKQKMSITQTYFLAHSARGKLSKEAARPDHDLRLLVGHANMLDTLMLDLANAEQEQERWFNKSVSESREEEDEPVHKHVETIMEDEEEENAQITETEVDSDMEEDDEDDEELTLTRSPSRHSPPALSSDSDSDSDDEMPPSPPQPTMEYLSEKQRQAIATTSFYDTKDVSIISPVESEAFEQEGFYLPSRQQPIQIAAY